MNPNDVYLARVAAEQRKADAERVRTLRAAENTLAYAAEARAAYPLPAKQAQALRVELERLRVKAREL